MEYKIVIPIHNEEKHIRELLKVFPKKHLPFVIFVDDGSTDNTKKILEQHPQITTLKHKINLGKGKSLETGTLHAIKQKADIVVFMDGDLQHKPEDIDRFLRALKKSPKTNIVFGARKIGKNMRLMPFLGNKLLTIIINLLFRYLLNDTQCGFRAFRTKIFKKIRWESPGYAAETEMIINAAKHRLGYKEILIDTIYLDHYKGTIFLDGIIILFQIIMWKLFKR